MEIFWKSMALVLVAVLLGIQLAKQNKDMEILLTMAACLLIFWTAIRMLEPVIDFLKRIGTDNDIRIDLLEVILKCFSVGIGTEFAGTICMDAGNTALNKSIHFLGITTILYIALPVFSGVIELMQRIIGGI